MPIPVLNLHSSLFLAIFLWLIHCGGLLIVCLVPLSLDIKIIVALVLVISLRRSLAMHAQRTPSNAIVQIKASGEGFWQLILNNGKSISTTLCKNSVITPAVAVMNFKTKRKWQYISVVICADGVDKDKFRELRAWLFAYGR